MRFKPVRPAPSADAVVVEYLSMIVYLTQRETPNGTRFFAMGFRGKAARPFANYIFKTEEQRAQWLEREKAGEDARVEYRAGRKAAQKAEVEKMRAQIVPGAILYTSWGYDQTNVEFFEVIERVSDYFVVIREIAQEYVETSYMSGRTKPKPGAYVGEPMRRKITTSGVSINEHRSAWLTTADESHHTSSYA